MPLPRPSARAVVPFAPSAPTTRSAGASARSIVVPSRTSTPRSRAASSRNASSRRRCVMRMTGAADLRTTAAPYRNRSSTVSTSSSTTGDGSTGHWRTARIVRPPPHGLSRGNLARATSSTRAPASASRYAVVEPAGPPPTTSTSKRSMPLRLQSRLPGGVPERPKGTGCKPVGSAYGGSNPPAPTHSPSFPSQAPLSHRSILTGRSRDSRRRHEQADRRPAFRVPTRELVELAVCRSVVVAGGADAELAAMGGRDRVDEREAQARTFAAAGELVLSESCCRAGKERRIDLALVVNRDDRQRRIRCCVGRQRDGAAAVADRVVGEVAERALEQRRVAVDAEAVGGLHDDRAVAPVGELRLGAARGTAEERLDADVRRIGRRASERAKREQCLGEIADARGVVREPAERRFVFVPRPRLSQCDVDLGGQGAEGRAQLVACVVDEFLLTRRGPLERVEHRVQHRTEASDLVRRALRDAEADAGCASCDSLRLRAGPPDP